MRKTESGGPKGLLCEKCDMRCGILREEDTKKRNVKKKKKLRFKTLKIRYPKFKRVKKKTVRFSPSSEKKHSHILEGLNTRFVIKMVDTQEGTKELAKKLTFEGGVGFDVTTDDDDVFFSNNPAEKEDAEKKRAASIARAKEDPKAQSLRR